MAEPQAPAHQPSETTPAVDVRVSRAVESSGESSPPSSDPNSSPAQFTIKRKPVPSTPSSDRKKPANATVFFKSWALELFSCFLALIGFAAIIVVLTIQDGHPLPEWPAWITINSLISIFTAIMKSAMIMPVAESINEQKWIWFSSRERPLLNMDHFDSASRGPLGSLNLLFRIPRAFWACLGALVTLGALGIDPFTQQIIQTRDCYQPATSSAWISRANTYNIPPGGLLHQYYYIDATMLAALYTGALNPPENATAAISVSCPTRDCFFLTSDDETFTYRSLAVCYDVSDISDQISSGPDNDPSSAFWSFTLPSGLKIQGPGAGGPTFECGMIQDSVGNTKTPIYKFEVLMSAPASSSTSDVTALAFSAEFYPCLNTYRGSRISNSVLFEDITSSIRLSYINDTSAPFFSLAGDYPALPGVDCSPAAKSEGVDGNKNVSTRALPDGTRYRTFDNDTATSPDVLWYNELCVYNFNEGPTGAIRFALQGFFGNGTNTPTDLPWISEDDVLVEGPLWLQHMWAEGQGNSSTVTSVVRGIADTMTATVRMNDMGDTKAEGLAQVKEICTRVRWPWITLDAVLVVSMLLFFAITLWQSYTFNVRGRGQHGAYNAWKSSSLPLLWCGLDDHTKRSYGTPMTLSVMEEFSQQLMVKMEEKSDHGRALTARPSTV